MHGATAIGIDVGGTQIRAAQISAAGDVLADAGLVRGRKRRRDLARALERFARRQGPVA